MMIVWKGRLEPRLRTDKKAFHFRHSFKSVFLSFECLYLYLFWVCYTTKGKWKFHFDKSPSLKIHPIHLGLSRATLLYTVLCFKSANTVCHLQRNSVETSPNHSLLLIKEHQHKRSVKATLEQRVMSHTSSYKCGISQNLLRSAVCAGQARAGESSSCPCSSPCPMSCTVFEPSGE